LIQGIKNLFPFSAGGNQARLAQNTQVVGDRGLANARPFGQIAHAVPFAAKQTHNMLARLVGYGLGESYGIHRLLK
jgi:hypothetical protein